MEILFAIAACIVIGLVIRSLERSCLVQDRDRASNSETAWRKYALSLKEKLGKRKVQKGNRGWEDDDLHTRVMPDQMPTIVFDPASKSGVRWVGDRAEFKKRQGDKSSTR